MGGWLLFKIIDGCSVWQRNFRNEIVWNKGYRGTPRQRQYQQEHDIVFLYAAGDYTWNVQTVEYKDKDMSRYNKVDEDGKIYALIKRRRTDGTVYYGKSYPRGKLIGDVISVPTLASTAKERVGWKTQKPLALYERFVKASSNEGDVVLDPFAGCATTCVVAELLHRKWIGIDLDPVTETITKERLYKESGTWQETDEYVNVKKVPPRRTDIERISTERMRLMLWKKQVQQCANPYCSSEGLRIEDAHLDHMIPKSRGGPDSLDNRHVLCGNCNSRKGTKAWGAFLDEERSKQPHPKI